jgi:hypothetical protein
VIRIKVHKPSGFSCSGSVRIYSLNGKPFYFFNAKKNVHFNLPAGEYLSEFPIKKAALKKYKLPTLPKPERKLKLPAQFTFVFTDNPNTCSVLLEKGLIICDNKLRSFTAPALSFIYLHELGHYFYQSEENCDRYAARKMLKSGFNPSQIAEAPRVTLRGNNSRVKNCLNYAKTAV